MFTMVKCLFTWKKKTSNLCQSGFRKSWQSLQKPEQNHSTEIFKGTCATFLSRMSSKQGLKILRKNLQAKRQTSNLVLV